MEAIKRGESHYTLNTGIIELRQAVCDYYKNRFGLNYTPAEVIVAAGAKPLLYEAMQALVDDGDEVVLFARCVGQLRRAAAHGRRRRKGRRHHVDRAHSDERETP